MGSVLSVNAQRLVADLEALGQIGRVAAGGLSRTSFSATDTEARNWYFERCAEAGLTVVVDGLGNLIVSSPDVVPETTDRPAVWSGSHIDTVPNGGQFDGALGAIAALECLRRIHEEGIVLERPVRSIVYTDEEGSYAHLLGSSALARGYSLAELEAMNGRDGDRFVDAFTAAGGNLDAATRTKIDPATLHATVELHIEQGPTLENLGHEIGVVTGIVGLGGGSVTFRGRADHAGTTPMLGRKDALVAAGALVVAFPDLAARIGDGAVITSGVISVEPGSANVIPELVHVTVDFRHPDANQLAALEAEIRGAARAIADQYGVDVSIDLEPSIPPAPLNQGIQDLIAAAAAARGLSSSCLPSGAGHDSQNMATLAPTGMIFVPSIDGRSHCPQENTSWIDVENGANVLLDTLIQLAGS
ncbi:Zn-dependent hydrolase [Arthrobacter roseus]|uniref:Zn-dependent hydrolase n=1 Tax=Arthrobacter roseus TaxID=136274 RepID=UPI001964A367|nr:Zn-dependent hydrolase [Arthrobacter roseus]MBM7846813.1 N-carbamoyl-L-amino-acid hydrolase [Arthrobacter roseus]